MVKQRSGYVYLEDGTDAQLWMSYAMGVCALVACAALYWALGPDLVFDFNSPQFNPAVLFLPLSAAYGLYSLGRGGFDHARAKKWGKSTLEMPGEGPRMGRAFSGKVYGSAVAPTDAQYRITMRFVETFILNERTSSIQKERDNVQWEETATVDANVFRLENGIPFSFNLPPLKALKREVSEGSTIKAKATVHVSIPGMTPKTFAYNALPDKVRWTLEVAAKTEGVDYQAVFGLRVEERFPVKSGV